MPKILVLVPVMTKLWNAAHLEELARCKDATTEIVVASLCSGAESVESGYDDMFVAASTVLEVERAEREHYDGVVLSCFGDPALRAAKEAVSIPVVGVAEASIHVASILGRRYGVVAAGPSDAGAYIVDNLKMYEMDHKCVGVRSLGIPILGLERDRRDEVKRFLDTAHPLIVDGADVIVIGCTGMTTIAQELAEVIPAPVVNPAPVALKLCEDLISLHLSQSKLAFSRPSNKARTFEHDIH